MQVKNTFKECVSAELRGLRSKHKYTQEFVANIANIDVMTLNRYESGKVSMQLDTLEKIVCVYDINLFIFFNLVNANMHNNLQNIE